MRALNEMGAVRVRLEADGGVDVVFAGAAIPADKVEENRELEERRRKQLEQDDLFRSAG